MSKIAEKMVPGLVMAVVVMAFVMGAMWSRIQGLQAPQVPQVKQAKEEEPTVPPKAQVDIEKIKEVFGGNVIRFGDAEKKVLFVEVADPSCPYCHIAAGKNPELNVQAGDRFKLVSDGGTYVAPVPEMKKLVDEGKAGFVWLYTNGHGNGEMGTKAMYCAYEKGKFWEVHDLLMSSEGYDMVNNVVKNDKTKSGEMAKFLASAMNENQMRTCLDSGKYDGRLSEDSGLAASLGITGTPGFFINDKSFAGAYSWTEMESAMK